MKIISRPQTLGKAKESLAEHPELSGQAISFRLDSETEAREDDSNDLNESSDLTRKTRTDIGPGVIHPSYNLHYRPPGKRDEDEAKTDGGSNLKDALERATTAYKRMKANKTSKDALTAMLDRDEAGKELTADELSYADRQRDINTIKSLKAKYQSARLDQRDAALYVALAKLT